MRILIVAATIQEIQPFLNHFGHKDRDALLIFELNTGTEVEVLLTGVGMVATAYQMGKKLSTYSYDLVINAGIAGSFNTLYPIGATVQVIEEYFAELGAESPSGFIAIDDLGLGETNKVTATNNIPINHLYTLPKVIGVTVNKVHGNTDSIVELETMIDADVESMEGGAAMYVCVKENINFIEIRTISNKVEPRNKANWNIPLAIKNLNQTLIAIINEF